jgi:hypothetical protein
MRNPPGPLMPALSLARLSVHSTPTCTVREWSGATVLRPRSDQSGANEREKLSHASQLINDISLKSDQVIFLCFVTSIVQLEVNASTP